MGRPCKVMSVLKQLFGLRSKISDSLIVFLYSHFAMHKIAPETLTNIVQRYGTPLWVYDAEVIRQRIHALQSFDVIRYAQKACSNTHILRLMRQEGVVVDAVSLGEIQRALQAGYSLVGKPGRAAEIVFTADIFDRATLAAVIENKVEVNAGSIDMLTQLGEHSPGHRIWLRINPGFGHGHSHKTNTGGENSKHGIWYSQLDSALQEIQKYRLQLVGLHMHIGSGVDYAHLERVCDAMVSLVTQVEGQLTYPLEVISAGGGLSIPYKKGEHPINTQHYFSLWDQARQRIVKQLGYPVRLEIEPGRFLVAESGSLVSEVRAVKQMGNNHFVLVDAGFNDLMRPSMYGSYHEISVLAKNPKNQLAVQSLPQPTVVAGPLCESGDVFTQDDRACIAPRLLPPTEVGDSLVFHDAGAYGASMSSNYNSRPLLAEVLVDADSVKLIRRRQTIDELLDLEKTD